MLLKKKLCTRLCIHIKRALFIQRAHTFNNYQATGKVSQLFFFLVDYTAENINISPNEHELINEELKTIIKDHQSVME